MPSGKPDAIYLRREFTVEQADKITELGLSINFADSFIAYINGHEVGRVGVGRSSGRNAQKIKPREGRGRVYVPLNDAYKYARDGVNVFAIEVHAAEGSQDMYIDPSLLLED